MGLSNHSGVQYQVDVDNVIVDVNPQWDVFAQANDGKSLCTPEIIGKPLLSYVAGDATRMFVEILFHSARVQNKTITKPYRCDSPDIRRYMEMRIVPQDKGSLNVEHHVLALQTVFVPVRFVGHRLDGKRTDGHIKRCSMCNSVEIDGQWKDALDHKKRPLILQSTICNGLLLRLRSVQIFH